MGPIDTGGDSAFNGAEEKAVAGREAKIDDVSIDAGDDGGGGVQGLRVDDQRNEWEGEEMDRRGVAH